MRKEDAARGLIGSIESVGARKVAQFCDDGFKGTYAVLKAVHLGRGAVCAADLARALDVSTARITVALNALERKGYVRRERGTRGGRRTHLSVTPAGEEQLRTRETEMVERLAGMMEPLSEEEAEELLRLVEKIAAGPQADGDGTDGK